jgi:hypothetical protein
MRLQLFTVCGFSVMTLGLLSGCEGGQTGDLSGEHPNGGGTLDGSGCEEHKQKLAGFDEMTDFGTAQELLAYAEKSFDAPVTWKTASDGESWSVGPESGQGTLHLAVTRGESAYTLTYTAKPQSGANATLDVGTICPPPQLGVEAHVDVTTDGGALAESYDTLLRSNTAGVATLGVALDLKKVGGSLVASSSDAKAKLVQLSLEATLTSAGMTGKIAGIEQVDSGSGASASSSAKAALLAVWPDSAACQAGEAADGEGITSSVEQETLGVTGTDSLASVTPAKPVSITWMDGTKTMLTLGIASLGDGCFRVRHDVPIYMEGYGPGVSYPVTITLKSDDGRLDGSYPGQVLATGTDSTRRVTATAQLQLAVNDVTKSGFKSVSVPSGADKLLLELDVRRISGSASGSVHLFALSSVQCPMQPATPQNGASSGSSSPGCSGGSEQQLETADWTQ